MNLSILTIVYNKQPFREQNRRSTLNVITMTYSFVNGHPSEATIVVLSILTVVDLE